jgi:hypothetical protein
MLDWTNLNQVKAYSTKLARLNKSQQSVVMRKGSTSYIIIATKNEHRHKDITVVFRTGVFK